MVTALLTLSAEQFFQILQVIQTDVPAFLWLWFYIVEAAMGFPNAEADGQPIRVALEAMLGVRIMRDYLLP